MSDIFANITEINWNIFQTTIFSNKNKIKEHMMQTEQ